MSREFFRYARERQRILLRRNTGEAPPWTLDPILRRWRFCNVFREDDKTTVWFRKNVRQPLRDRKEVVLATAIFRWFNRISTGEALFLQKDLFGGRTAFELFAEGGDTGFLRRALLAYCGAGPYVTGSHYVNLTVGLPMPDSILYLIRLFAENGWEDLASLGMAGKLSLEEGAARLMLNERIGSFLSYEIATDLRHTAMLEQASDIMTWCNMGSGSRRGFSRVIHGDVRRVQRDEFLDGCSDLLERSQANWPATWKKWEMREVEHTLCEYDKYERIRLGEGQVRGIGRWEN